MHAGHEIIKCECGKVIRQCRCMDCFKPTVIQRPCKCEKEDGKGTGALPPKEYENWIGKTPAEIEEMPGEEKTLQQKLAQVAHDTCVAHKGAHGCCYVVNLAVKRAIENYEEN